MKDAQPKAVRLAEYSPPSHRITDTHLEFDLRDGVTQVTARLLVERNGSETSCGSTDRNSNWCRWRSTAGSLSSNEYQVDDDSMTLFDLPEEVRVDDRHAHPSRAERGARGFVQVGRLVGWHVLHPVRGRGVSQDHVLPRSTGRALAVYDDDHRGRPLSRAVVERQSDRRTPPRRRPPQCHLAGSVSETELPVCARRRRPRIAARRVRHRVRAPHRAAHLLGAAQHLAMRRTRWVRCSAPCAGTKPSTAANTTSTSS